MSKHYIRINENNHIIHGFSDVFEQPLETDICINEEGGRHFELSSKTNLPLLNEFGRALYKYINGEILETTEEERIDLNTLKGSKIKAIKQACYNKIVTGFVTKIYKGTMKHYSSTPLKQSKIDK